jgi:hypothetical protein
VGRKQMSKLGRIDDMSISYKEFSDNFLEYQKQDPFFNHTKYLEKKLTIVGFFDYMNKKNK